MFIIISENISLQIGLLVPGIVYLILLLKPVVSIVSKIGLTNTGITFEFKYNWKAGPTGPEAVKFFS